MIAETNHRRAPIIDRLNVRLFRTKQDSIGPRRTTSKVVAIGVEMVFVSGWKSNRCFGVRLQDVCLIFQFLLLIGSRSIIQITEEKHSVVFVDLPSMLLTEWSKLHLLMNASVLLVTSSKGSGIVASCEMIVEKTQGLMVEFETNADSTFIPVEIQKTLHEKTSRYVTCHKSDQHSRWELDQCQWTSIGEREMDECR